MFSAARSAAACAALLLGLSLPVASQAQTPPTVTFKSATMDAVRQRGKLNCGVNEGLLGFALLDPGGEWRGFEPDLCRAVASAVLGDANAVTFVPLDTNTRFTALQDKRVDIVARNTTWTMERQVKLGVGFAGISFFDGQGFMVPADSGIVSALQLSNRRVCVVKGTTTEENLNAYIADHKLSATPVLVADHKALTESYLKGACDAMTTDHSTLFSDRAQFPEAGDHTILPEQISKEPLSLVVRGDDPVWMETVRWVFYGLVNAEEYGLTQAIAKGGKLEGDAKRLSEGAAVSGQRLGLQANWLTAAVAATGHYGELFDRNVGRLGPLGMRRGLNALWNRGGLLYAPPMW